MSDATLPNGSTALASVVVDELIRNGVRHLVIAPGSRSAPLAMTAASNPDVTLHVELDERSASFLALGIGRAGDGPAAVLTTSGSAVANLHPAAIEAAYGGVPLLLLTADRPPELRDVGANQTIDQERIFGPTVRWFATLGPAEDRPGEPAVWRATVCRAVAEAVGRGRAPGPVHLDLAFREPLVPASDDGRTVAAPYRGDVGGRPEGAPWTAHRARPAGVVELPEKWASIERGLVVAGDMTGIRDTAAIADRLAARLGWPLVVEPTAGGRPAQTISAAHHLVSHPGFAAANRPDVALVLGRVGLSRTVQGFLRDVPRVVADPYGWSDPERAADELLAGIPVVVNPDLPDREGSDWRKRWLEAERAARRAVDLRLEEEDLPSEPRLARDVGRALVAGDVLVVGSSMPIRDVDAFLAPGPFSIVANRGASGIDGFVSSVLGIAAAGGEGSVVGLAGDLSMLHDTNGFLLAERPDAVFVIASNDGGGIFSFLPQARFPEHFERIFGTPHGRSFELLAGFHGLGHRRVDSPGEVVGAIEQAAEEGGVQLVEVPTDRGTNVELHRRITADVHAALDRERI